MGARDDDLVVLGVAVEGDDLHAVEQRGRDGVGDVGRREEHHVGQVEFDLEVVVAEGVVLRRVEHLEQGRRRVTAVVAADLVDLVQQHDRVHRTGFADGADDATGQRADVGAPVAADLGLVAHAAQGDTDELAAERTRNRLAQRGLADAGRADEREHRAGATSADDLEPAVRTARAHGEVLGDAVLHVVEAVVVGVEHSAGRGNIVVVVRLGVPRKFEDGVEPGADPACLGALVGRALELADLAHRGLVHLGGQGSVLDPGAVVVSAFRLVLAEFLADRGELLAQQEFALGLVHALADVVADLLADLLLGHVLARPLGRLGQPLGDLGRLEQLTLLLQTQIGRVAGEVGDLGRVVDALDGVDDLPGVAPLQDRDDDALELGGELAVVLGRVRVVDRGGLDPQRSAGTADPGADLGAGDGTEHCGRSTTGQPPDLLDLGDRAVDGIAVRQARGEQQLTLGAAVAGRIDDRLRGVVQFDRHDHAGQHDDVGERQHRQVQREAFLSHTGSSPSERRMFPAPIAVSEQVAVPRTYG